MSNHHAFPLLTSSQENEMMSVVSDINLHDLDQLLSGEQLEQKYDISQHLSAPQQQQDQPAPILPEHIPQAQVPVNEEFCGNLNFNLVPDQQEDTKAWTYSQILKKVFIEMDKTLPVRIMWNPLLRGLFIKASITYCQPTYRSEPVTRCPNHIASSNPTSPHLLHVVSCKHANAVYQNNGGYFSVMVPLGMPQPGSDSVQMDFAFHCKNSCSTGINRRPTEVVFNLENERGEVLGRRKLLVRICSCPKRDRDKEEKLLREMPTSKKRKLNPGKKSLPHYRELPQLENESEIFHFSATIYGRENYEIMKTVCYGLMAGMLEKAPNPTVIKQLMDDIKLMR